jgi:hypothetical protein
MSAERRVTNQSNGTLREPVRVEDEQTDENIFLFVPNLIGKSVVIFQENVQHQTDHPFQAIFASS